MRQPPIYLLFAGLLLSGWCSAQLNVDQSYLSFDTDNVLELGTQLELGDDQLLSWSPGGGFEVDNTLADGRMADLTGFTISNSQIFLTFDTTIEVLDGTPQENLVLATPADIVTFNGVDQYGKIAVAALENSNARIDGLSVGDNGLIITLDKTTRLVDGSTTTAEPADVLELNEDAGYPLLFDASEMGLEPTTGQSGLNVNAISYDKNKQLLYLSFDTGGIAAGKHFEASTIFVYDPAKKTMAPWGDALDGLVNAGLSRGTKLNAMMLTVIPKPETVFRNGFE